MHPDIKQYFKVKAVSHKPDGNIKLIDTQGNSYKILKATAPYLKVGDVFQGKPALDLATNSQSIVVIKLLTDDDTEVIVATFPPNTPQEIQTP